MISHLAAMPIYYSMSLLICFFLCLYRLVKGPLAADRIIVIDIIGVLLVSMSTLAMIFIGRRFLMDIAISWAILGFIGTLALAKYLEGKNFDE